ncbi:MAG: hypothetical protein A3E82_08530 [Gammaproteobacteria bacterium RIFCSPHIGHO2_12_FULL_38_11]|nr:MAG: hypothetical protein A3E82_08530 [Gammaproteobacteria bacterium RIFCSPHIGHO2_12_FULL_38_11]
MLPKQIKANTLCVLLAAALTSSNLFALPDPSTHDAAKSAIQRWKDTHKPHVLKQHVMPRFQAAYKIKYPLQVDKFIGEMNPQNILFYLTKLVSYEDRSANSINGQKAATWIKDEIEKIAKVNRRNDINIYFVDSGSNAGEKLIQPSVIVKIGTSNDPGIVIGAHLDTLPVDILGHSEIKPGADDDGSGSATLLELARTLISSDIRFKKPIYIIWYAAEEWGLIGSEQVVTEFKNKNIPIAAVLQLDMTGYRENNDPTMWLINDYVNPELTSFLEKLINVYIKQPVQYTTCNYSFSDHASWNNAGIPSSIAYESKICDGNPNVHTSADTMSTLSLPHMTNFAKLAAAFTIELSEPIEKN